MTSFKKRTLAREYAFKFLYHLQLPDFKARKDELMNSAIGDSFALKSALEEFNENYGDEDALLGCQDLLKHLGPSEMNFAGQIISGVLKQNSDIVEIIKNSLKNWKFERLDKIDVTILFISVYELQFVKDTPIKVAINEALNIAKKFGSKESSTFINGILDNVAKTSPKRLK